VSSLLAKMKAATTVKRGDPGIKDTVEAARDEMNRFVSYYRRNNKVCVCVCTCTCVPCARARGSLRGSLRKARCKDQL
jgi:hypothetical protein